MVLETGDIEAQTSHPKSTDIPRGRRNSDPRVSRERARQIGRLRMPSLAVHSMAFRGKPM